MYIVLAQRLEANSGYLDQLFKIYHYPSKYKNQIHEGDFFIYYQYDLKNSGTRCYFGSGEIGAIEQGNDNTYYANLTNCNEFNYKVPVYLEEIGYVEKYTPTPQETLVTPAWRNSIRVITEDAYNFIIQKGTLNLS